MQPVKLAVHHVNIHLETRAKHARWIADSVLSIHAEVLANDVHHVTASIGITIYPDCAPDSESLLRYADFAMFDAKKSGPNQIRVYRAGTG